MSAQFIPLCHDCASSAELDYMFYSMPWFTKNCEFCGKRGPCVMLEAGLRGKVEKALKIQKEPNGEETKGKKV